MTDNEKIRDLIRAINDEVEQLEAWAYQSEDGAWSTHQVLPMRERADKLRQLLHKCGHRSVKGLSA